MSKVPDVTAPKPPSEWVARFAGLVPPGGPVLDVACGGGRHARLFLARGHAVVGLDRDLSRIGDLGADGRFTAVPADLEDGSPWPLPGVRFAGVVVTNYLHRPLLATLPGLLLPGGVLIYETFAVGHERLGRPSRPDFLLRPGELLDAVRPDLTVLAYENGRIDSPGPRVVQRICAVRGEDAGRCPLPPA